MDYSCLQYNIHSMLLTIAKSSFFLAIAPMMAAMATSATKNPTTIRMTAELK